MMVSSLRERLALVSLTVGILVAHPVSNAPEDTGVFLEALSHADLGHIALLVLQKRHTAELVTTAQRDLAPRSLAQPAPTAYRKSHLVVPSARSALLVSTPLPVVHQIVLARGAPMDTIAALAQKLSVVKEPGASRTSRPYALRELPPLRLLPPHLVFVSSALLLTIPSSLDLPPAKCARMDTSVTIPLV